MSGIVFLDTETLGVAPEAPIWEFAAIWRPNLSRSANREKSAHFTIQHTPGQALNLPTNFAADYHARYNPATALPEHEAAQTIHDITTRAQLVACNPVFDEPRLADLLRRNGITPAWHYHPDDIASIVKGYLAARGQLPKPPWKSDSLSQAIGVNPAHYQRHTALGDAEWVKAQYDVVMRG